MPAHSSKVSSKTCPVDLDISPSDSLRDPLSISSNQEKRPYPTQTTRIADGAPSKLHTPNASRSSLGRISRRQEASVNSSNIRIFCALGTSGLQLWLGSHAFEHDSNFLSNLIPATQVSHADIIWLHLLTLRVIGRCARPF
jgi:hypothetical protein